MVDVKVKSTIFYKMWHLGSKVTAADLWGPLHGAYNAHGL